MADISNEVALIQKASRGEEVRDAIVGIFEKLEADQDALIKKDEAALTDGMRKSVYDADGDGVVDNAKRVDGHSVGADVPADAKFTDTDTVYDDAAVRKLISDSGLKISDLESAVGKAATKEELAAAKTELEGKIGSGSGGSGTSGTGQAEISVDEALSDTSVNPVQNKAVSAALKKKQDALTIDSVPTAGSGNLVSSGGVAEAIGKISAGVTKDEVQAMIEKSVGSVLAEAY